MFSNRWCVAVVVGMGPIGCGAGESIPVDPATYRDQNSRTTTADITGGDWFRCETQDSKTLATDGIRFAPPVCDGTGGSVPPTPECHVDHTYVMLYSPAPQPVQLQPGLGNLSPYCEQAGGTYSITQDVLELRPTAGEMRTLRDLRMTAGCANTMQEPCMLKATDRTLHDTIFLQTPEPWSHSTGACP